MCSCDGDYTTGCLRCAAYIKYLLIRMDWFKYTLYLIHSNVYLKHFKLLYPYKKNGLTVGERQNNVA